MSKTQYVEEGLALHRAFKKQFLRNGELGGPDDEDPGEVNKRKELEKQYDECKVS